MHIRIGTGYDVHKLEKGFPLTLGGIQIPHEKGSVGHSDADVLIHALCDALLGAASLRDIGFHFPDTEAKYKGIDSKILLKKTVQLLENKGFKIGNIDSVIILQKPKIKPFIPQMQKILAETMQISLDDVSVKATTTEHLGFEGREEGIAATVSVLIFKEESI
ncbi:MAG: 2-C-methyl-D-erythritol 2,4-cyclodiphosphate synthase [Bacteroidia bacterium]|nr:MAG: 2-C-methyl-D-erythritol 2,4-cyclodiphosphate synthase [Bacteroidia bacterium]